MTASRDTGVGTAAVDPAADGRRRTGEGVMDKSTVVKGALALLALKRLAKVTVVLAVSAAVIKVLRARTA
ncbi:MAG: hypothetical protein M3N52_11035 [Actinomycetota bacterium]|nr:hypothetical protein [Actinomycetota bacterium]